MKTRTLLTLVASAVLICVLCSAAHVLAATKTAGLEDHARTLGFSKAVPSQLNYQGYLVDAADSSAVTGSLEMTFRLFDSQTKGTELWSETHPAVEVNNGLFHVLLGSVTLFAGSLFDGSTLWLQTEVGAEVLTPRKPLVSVAYSHRTQEADHAVHADTAAYSPSTNPWTVSGDNIYRDTGKVGIGTISPSYLLDVNGPVNATTYHGDGSNLTGIAGAPDADWTISGNDMYSAVSGNVGIGTTSPYTYAKLHLNVPATGNFDRLQIECPSTNNGFGISFTQPNGEWYIGQNIGNHSDARFAILNDVGSFYRLVILSNGKVGIGTTSPTKLLDVNGGIQADTLFLGSSSKAGKDGEFHLYRGGSADPVVHSYADNYGGNIILNDELGNLAIRLHADNTGSGGEFWLGRDVGKVGIELIGNSGGSNEPVLGIMGSTRAVYFYMNQSGDASVVLPNNAISAPEMLDEPGIARNSMSGGTSIAASGVTHIINQSITVPGPGYIMARGYLYGGIHGTSIGNITVGIGTSSTDPPTLPDAVVFGSDNEPLSSSHYRWGNLATERTFTVAAGGTYTYYLNAERFYTDGTAMVWYPKLLLIYFPTNYGSVTKSGGTVMSSGAVDDGVGKSQ